MSTTSDHGLEPVMWPGPPKTSLPHRRTKQACDNCKARKAKCSNTKPCTNCQEADILCTSVKAMSRKSARDWEIEMLRSERTRLVSAVKVLYKQLATHVPELYPLGPGADLGNVTVTDIVERIELDEHPPQKGSDEVHVIGSSSSSPDSCNSSHSNDGTQLGVPNQRRPSLSPRTPANTPLTQNAPPPEKTSQPGDYVAVDDFNWQQPDAELPSWSDAWPGFGDGGRVGFLNGLDDVGMSNEVGPVDGIDPLSMERMNGDGGIML